MTGRQFLISLKVLAGIVAVAFIVGAIYAHESGLPEPPTAPTSSTPVPPPAPAPQPPEVGR